MNHSERWEYFFDSKSLLSYYRLKKEKKMKVRIKNEGGEYMEFDSWKALHLAVHNAEEKDEVKEIFEIWLEGQTSINLRGGNTMDLTQKVNQIFDVVTIHYKDKFNAYDGTTRLASSPRQIIFKLWKEFIYDPQNR